MSAQQRSWDRSRRINAAPQNIIRDSTGARIGVKNRNGTVTPLTSNLGRPLGAFHQSRADMVLAARVDGSFEQKRAVFNKASKDTYMNDNGDIVSKAPPTPTPTPTTQPAANPPTQPTPNPPPQVITPAVVSTPKPEPMVAVPGPMGSTKFVRNPAAFPAPAQAPKPAAPAPTNPPVAATPALLTLPPKKKPEPPLSV